MKTLSDLKLLDLDKWNRFLAFRERRLNGFKTGIPRLDRELMGLSGIVILQGEPGSCKSTLALQIATHLAKEGTPVLIIDRENGLNRFNMRLTCQLNGVDQLHVLNCPEERLRELMSPIPELPMYVENSDTVNPDMIRSYVEQLWEIYKKPMLLVVDSLQSLPRQGQEERIALEGWLGALDQLKLDYDGRLVTIMTSEKSRGKYREATKEGGKGTGNIEFKGEIVLDMRSEPDSPVIKAQIVKNRDGACSGDMLFQKQLASAHPNSFTYKLEEHYEGSDEF